jgi:hypothetical protein
MLNIVSIKYFTLSGENDFQKQAEIVSCVLRVVVSLSEELSLNPDGGAISFTSVFTSVFFVVDFVFGSQIVKLSSLTCTGAVSGLLYAIDVLEI